MAVTTKTDAAPIQQPPAAAPAEAPAAAQEPQMLLLELSKIERFYDYPSSRLFLRHHDGDLRAPINAFEFTPEEARAMLRLRDPNGLPVFRAYRRRVTKAMEQTDAVQPVKRRPPEELDTAMSRWASNGDGRGVDLGEGEDDPEIAERLAALDAQGDGTEGARTI